MFMLFSSYRVFGAVFCLLFVGFCLLPVQTCLQVVGGLCILVSLITFGSAPLSGTVFILAGVALIVVGRKWQVRVDEKAAKDLEAAAAGWRRRMEPQFPLDEER